MNTADEWDVIAVLAQAVSDAQTLGFDVICTEQIASNMNISLSAAAKKYLETCNGLPHNEIAGLITMLARKNIPVTLDIAL